MGYAACWLVIFFGPNSDAFTGVGTSEYGVEPPENVTHYLMKLLVIAVFQGLSLGVIHLFMKCLKDQSGFTLQHLLNEYGVVWSLQIIWIVNTAFCTKMLSCGLDFSFSWNTAPTTVTSSTT